MVTEWGAFPITHHRPRQALSSTQLCSISTSRARLPAHGEAGLHRDGHAVCGTVPREHAKTQQATRARDRTQGGRDVWIGRARSPAQACLPRALQICGAIGQNQRLPIGSGHIRGPGPGPIHPC